VTQVSSPIAQQQAIRVLLIEDDEDDFILTQDLLRGIEGTEFRIDWKPDYDLGLQALCEREYDVCIVDYRLGLRDGVQLVREATGRGCRPPIIVLTGQDGRDVDYAAMRAGAADFLSKSQITAPLLERSIRYSSQQRRAEEQRIELVRAQVARREAEAANAAKDQFLATLSHELRTPLNAILGWTQLLQMPDLDEQTRAEAIDAIDRNARAQAQLIDDLLDMSRIISGKIRINRQPVVLSQVVKSAIESVRPAAQAKNLHLERQIGDGVGIMIGDATRLQQVVWNLLSNAIKFTPEGGRVTVRLTRERDTARLLVIDTGQGIEPDFLPHIFERFQQADSSTTRKQTGLGLGLAIVRHLVSLHGGSVWADSEGLGKGATFFVELPVIDDAELKTALVAGDEPLVIDQDTLRGLRVLVVDDERDTRTVMAKVLAMHGAVVDAAGNVSEAVEHFASRRPDVMVSDLAMPGEDGFSLARRIRQHEQTSGRHVVAIALSAYTGEQDRQAALAAGFDAHLSKPIAPTDLITAIARLAPSKAR
jgi:signal transduction histidine kinase